MKEIILTAVINCVIQSQVDNALQTIWFGIKIGRSEERWTLARDFTTLVVCSFLNTLVNGIPLLLLQLCGLCRRNRMT